MFAVAVTLEIAAGRMAEFKPAMMANARASLEEPACNRFDVLSDPDRPDELFLYELYDDEAGFEAHQQTAHYKTFNATAGDMVLRKVVTTYRVVEG